MAGLVSAFTAPARGAALLAPRTTLRSCPIGLRSLDPCTYAARRQQQRIASVAPPVSTTEEVVSAVVTTVQAESAKPTPKVSRKAFASTESKRQPRQQKPQDARQAASPKAAGKTSESPGQSNAKKLKVRAAKQVPIIKISPNQEVGAASAFLKRSLVGDGQAMVVCGGDEAIWQAFRVLRCARSMLIEDEGTTPVFQPVILREAKIGLNADSMIMYTHKIVNGQFNVNTVMRVSNDSRVELVATAIVERIKEKGSCVLESFGKFPAVISIKAIEKARRRMMSDRMDVAVALDPVVVEVDRADIGATMMNRFVLLECATRDPTNLRVQVNMRLRPAQP